MTAEPPVPDEEPDPLTRLRLLLRDLYLHSGEPSTRTIAKETNRAVSHTTVSKVLNCTSPPRWRQLEAVVVALGGDVELFRKNWIEMRTAAAPDDRSKSPPRTYTHEEVAELHAEIERLRRDHNEALRRVTSQRVHVLDQPRTGERLATGPTVLRMLLGSQLRRLREARGLTREAAGWEIRASESKITRMELGRVGFKERDVADLMTLYGVVDQQERAALLGMARQANKPGWWHHYSDLLPDWFQSYLGLEVATSLIRTYETQFVPGPLQTSDYARAVVLLRHGRADAQEIERRVALRMARKRLLRKKDGPRLWVVVDEAALRRPVGGRAVMRAQITALLDAVTTSNVALQVLPFRAGGHAGATGAFTLLRFPDLELPDVVYMEQLTSALYLDEREDVDNYRAVMEQLCLEAETPARTVEILEGVLSAAG
jgi:hypothetical protein